MKKYKVETIRECNFDFEVGYAAEEFAKKMAKKKRGFKVISVSIGYNSDSRRWSGLITYTVKK